MFKKNSYKPKRPLSERITRACLAMLVDELVECPDGTHEIRQVEKPPVPEQFRDLGDAECYGIAYLQTKGVDLSRVEAASRVTPMEAINIAESAIDNLPIPNADN